MGMDEEHKPKPLLQVMEESRNALNQFAFIVFIPNPTMHSVQIWIDDGSIQTVMSVDDFVNAIKKICGPAEADRIEVACMEYGTPYLYDRDKAQLRQLEEQERGRDLHFSADYHKEFENNGDIHDINTRFDNLVKPYSQVMNFGMPKNKFSSMKNNSNSKRDPFDFRK